MWTFYYDVATATSPARAGDLETWGFALLVLVTGLVVLAPSFIEKRQE